MISAHIFDIKRFGVNDGGGIRTVLFVKGCPMRCKWCQNPEGLISGIRVWHSANVCVGCRCCEAACGLRAASFDERGFAVNHDLCTLCGECVKACPTGAVRFDARSMTVDEAMAEIEKDSVFYANGGGVTLSGGECTVSPEFSLAVLDECHKRGINTAIETCLYTTPELLEAFSKAADAIIADIKLIDPARHVEDTGVDNALILENIKQLARSGRDLLLRVPLIPGYTSDRENLEGIARFIASLDVAVPVQLINFNPMCREKYRSLRQDYAFLPEQRVFTPDEMRGFKNIMAVYGLNIV